MKNIDEMALSLVWQGLARVGRAEKIGKKEKSAIILYIIYYILSIKYYYFLFLLFQFFRRFFTCRYFWFCIFAYINDCQNPPYPTHPEKTIIRPLPQNLGYLDKSLQVIDLYNKKAILSLETVRIALHTF